MQAYKAECHVPSVYAPNAYVGLYLRTNKNLFSSSYLNQPGFSHNKNLSRKTINRLNITEFGDLPSLSIKCTPNIKSTMEKHQTTIA